MSIGVGARPLGMGGTFAAIADDASTSYWNAAGMTNIQGVEVSSVKLTKINDLDTKYSYVNLVYNTGAYGAIGLGWLRQAIDGINITDALGDSKGIKENADNVVYIAYAYPIVKGFSAGGSVKILMGNYPALTDGGNLATINYGGFGVDLGVFFKVGDFVPEMKWLTLGVNVQDVYTSVTWDAVQGSSTITGGAETVGLNMKPGVALRFPIQQFELIASSDIDTRYSQMIIHAGGEIWWNKMVAIRGGIKSWGPIANGAGGDTLQQKPDWSLGASVRWYFIGVDFAYVYNELTPVQYLSIIGKF